MIWSVSRTATRSQEQALRHRFAVRKDQPGGSEAEACFPYTTVRTLPPWDWVGTQGVDIEESSAVDEDGGVEDVRNATGLEKEDILTGIVTSYEASASLVPLAAPARFTVGEHRMRAQVAFISGEVRETPSTVPASSAA